MRASGGDTSVITSGDSTVISTSTAGDVVASATSTAPQLEPATLGVDEEPRSRSRSPAPPPLVLNMPKFDTSKMDQDETHGFVSPRDAGIRKEVRDEII